MPLIPINVLRYLATLPERTARAIAAGIGGATFEVAQLVLPRFVRQSRLYEATAKNMLRIAVELVGDVQTAPSAIGEELAVGRVAVKKAAGNVTELGSIVAFGFSPLWLLAGAADILNGSRVYLRALEAELMAHGVLSSDARFASVDQLMRAFEGGAGTTARLIDLPPLELAELRRSLAELRADAASLPTAEQLSAIFAGLQRTARVERRSLLEVSTGVGLAFALSARHISREHLAVPYREDWQPLRDEGFAAYATRIARPYRTAIGGHFSPGRLTFTERMPSFTRQAAAWTRGRLSRRNRRGPPDAG